MTVARSIALFVGTWADGDYDKPSFARIEISTTFLAKIADLRAAVAGAGLFSASVLWDGLDRHDPGPECFNMRGDELVVTATGFHFRAFPKHTAYNVETEHITFDELGRLLWETMATGRSIAFHLCDEQALIEGGALPQPEAALA